MAPYEEVMIASSDDDDDAAVLLVTPQARKRRRQSAIHDDDDEGEASQPTNAPPPPGGPHARGDDDIEEEDDDEVEIIQISTPASADTRRASKLLTILESDDEPEESPARPATGSKPKLELEPVRTQATPRSQSERQASSAGRRSSRIERKRQEKALAGPSARKLNFLSLDNCLEHTSSRHVTGGDDDEDEEFTVDEGEKEEEDPSEEEEFSRRSRQHKKRARSPPPSRYANGGDDLDEFIVDDNEVEYMDDDEEGVMDQHLSSADEDEEDVRATMQSREPSEWFSIYLRYLEESILDEDLDNKLRTSRRTPEYRLFAQSIHHIERSICSRRDALRSSVVWADDIMDNLHCATRFHSTRCSATTDCQACRRANHFATQLVQFGGFSCDSTELYRPNWMKKLRTAVREMDSVRASFELGTVCHARTLGFWQLLHAKHFWVALVDAKRHECGDGHGRIADDERKAFHKAEYGRYKRLISIVDKFSSETNESVTYMPNVWKKVTSHHVESQFLPTSQDKRTQEVRRGTMDSLVEESDGDETEDEEEEEEETEEDGEPEEKPPVPARSSSPEVDTPELENVTDQPIKATPRKRMHQSTIASSFGHSPVTKSIPPASGRVKNESAQSPEVTMKAIQDIDAEDLICLVCQTYQRDGAVVHGNYLHFYSCYRCAKRQYLAKHGCMVCDRPIENVLRILPLSKESRADILAQQATQ